MWHMHEKNVCRVSCAVYTSRRVQGSCHCLDAKSRKKKTGSQQQRLLSCWNLQHKKMWRRRSCVDVDNFQLGFRNRASSFLVPGSTCWDLSWFCFILPLQTTHCLFIRVDASPKSRRTRSTRMNLVSRKKRLSAEVVLLQNNQPNEC